MHRPVNTKVVQLAKVALAKVALAMGTLTWSAISVADELETPASWNVPSALALQRDVDAWVSQLSLSASAQGKIQAAWQGVDEESSPERVADAILQSAAAALPDQAAAIQAASQGLLMSTAVTREVSDAELPAVIQANVKAAIGKSLALNQLYDEASASFADVDLEQLADPASYLFYRSVCLYRMREKEQGISTLDKLLERKDELPDRYANMARLMRLDIEFLKPDSLDEVARIMDSIHVRLGHGHAGTRVRSEEQDVVDKLDKMIEDLEEQLQKMQAMAQGNANGMAPHAPAQDSTLPGGKSQGDVGRQSLGDKTDWGDLPPKEREASLQRLGKEFPSYYRDIIEEYFRNLARDKSDEEAPSQ